MLDPRTASLQGVLFTTSGHIPELGYGTCVGVVAFRGERLAVRVKNNRPAWNIPTDLV